MNKFTIFLSTLIFGGAIAVGADASSIPLPDDPQQPVIMGGDVVQSPGILLVNHHDVGMAVYLLGETVEIEFRHGAVEEVYDNGYYKIGVYSASYFDGSTIRFFKPNYLIVHRTTAFEDGGFAFLK